MGELHGFTDCPVTCTFTHMMEFEYQSKLLTTATYASKLRDTRGVVLGSIAG